MLQLYADVELNIWKMLEMFLRKTFCSLFVLLYIKFLIYWQSWSLLKTTIK